MLSSRSAMMVALAALSRVQAGQTHNLTPDAYWHNRYFGMLSMAAYGDYNTTCPTETFTEATLLKNFPDSQLPPWDVIETWGPTPSGAEGFSAVVPEMNKVVVVHKGNRALLDELPLTGCTMNLFAALGYLEAKNATNNWQATRDRYYGSGLIYAVTGHGLGGMHALINSVDYNYNGGVCWYSHNQGTPRTFNQAGADFYNSFFNGEAGERAVANNDQMGELIPASDDYAHAGTTFYYWGFNQSSGQMNWQICWDSPEDPACAPRYVDLGQNTATTPEEDHYYYHANVATCGDPLIYNQTIIDQFLAVTPNATASPVLYSGLPSTSLIPTASGYLSGSMSATPTSEVVAAASASQSSSASLCKPHIFIGSALCALGLFSPA